MNDMNGSSGVGLCSSDGQRGVVLAEEVVDEAESFCSEVW